MTAGWGNALLFVPYRSGVLSGSSSSAADEEADGDLLSLAAQSLLLLHPIAIRRRFENVADSFAAAKDAAITITNTTADQTLLSPADGRTRLRLASIHVVNSSDTATRLVIKDGGTVRGYIAAPAGNCGSTWQPTVPIPWTKGNSIVVAAAASVSALYVTAQALEERL